MRVDPHLSNLVNADDWLAAQCRTIEEAGRDLAQAVGEVNERTLNGNGAGQPITESQFRQAAHAVARLREVQKSIQNALFDCEHELRELREREVDPFELLVDGDRLIRQYRFLRRRARVIDGLLAYLPVVCTYASGCLEHLRELQSGAALEGPLTVPDCTFALVALEDLRDGSAAS